MIKTFTTQGDLGAVWVISEEVNVTILMQIGSVIVDEVI